MKITRVEQSHGRHYYIQDLEARKPNGRPKQKWIPLTRVDEGEPALLKALEQLLGKAPKREGNMKQLLEEFKVVHLPQLANFQVRKEYTRMYDVIAEEFEEYNAADVEPGDVLTFLGLFAGKLNTRGKYKARLATFFSWCVLNSHTGVKVNPCAEIRLSGPPKRKGKINDAVYWKIFDALTPMGQCFLELAYLTRQRPTEIRLLRDSHIGTERIHFVPTKTEHSTAEEVDILITPEIRACVERARALRRKKKVVALRPSDDAFVIQTRDGDGFSKNGLYEVWRDALEAAGLLGKNITTRDIRPYALASMERLGFDVRAIQLAAAHASLTTTEGYLDQHRDRLSDARLPLPERPKT